MPAARPDAQPPVPIFPKKKSQNSLDIPKSSGTLSHLYSMMNIYSDVMEMDRKGPGLRTNGVEAAEQLPLFTSCSHAPSPTARRVFNVVLHSGHFQSQPGEPLERRAAWGHEFFYCLNGSGYVFSESKQFRVNPFDLAWLSGLSGHWVVQAPWEVLWMRVAGHQVEQA